MSRSLLSVTCLLVLLVCVTVVSARFPALRRHSVDVGVASQTLPPTDITTIMGSVYYDGTNYKYVEGRNDSKPAATGSFKVGLNVTGWNELWIATDPSYPDAVQMFAAGYLEGSLTAARIIEFHEITDAWTGKIQPKVGTFLTDQIAWVRQQVANAPSTDTQWQGIGLIMAQFDGLVAGYNANPYGFPPLTELDFDVFQVNGDWGDILTAVNRETRPDFSKMTPQEILAYSRSRGHCSVLVKLTGDLSELYMAHSTWTDYSSMNRIFKHYNLQVAAPYVAAHKVSFSSYPGYLESLDDFYYMDSGLVMLETTNDVFNMSLFDLVKPQSLFAWQRVRLASQNARTGEEWYRHVSFHNSGTYNNQYAIVDLKLYKPGQPLVPNTLWVMEQIPGEVFGSDQTDLLTFGYFPSYNVPFFEHIYNASGYTSINEQMGTIQGFAYQNAPRAQIFRRDQGTVVDLKSFQAIMRYNDYVNDTISAGDPFSAICSRGDLGKGSGEAFGCTDTKVTTASLFKEGIAYILNGPTTNGGTLPPFSWSQFPTIVHSGEPDIYNFDFIPTQW